MGLEAVKVDWEAIAVAVDAGHQAIKSNTKNRGDEVTAVCCLLWTLAYEAERQGHGKAGELIARTINTTKVFKGRFITPS